MPCFARYAGDAQSSRRFGAMYRAITRESGGAPNRTQTSNESSVNGGGLTDSCSCTSTCGCLRTKREISGATWLRPKPSVALTRSRPFGVAFDSAEQFLHSVDLAQDAARTLQVQLTLGRQAHAPRRANDERHAQARLHQRQVLAHRRCRDAELASRRTQAAGAGQRREETEVGGLDAAGHGRRLFTSGYRWIHFSGAPKGRPVSTVSSHPIHDGDTINEDLSHRHDSR